MKNRCRVPLTLAIERYLKLQRSLGAIRRSDKYTLLFFNQYLARHFPKSKYVTREMVVGYLDTTRNLTTYSRYIQLSHLRQFCRFLFQLNPKTYIPEKALLPFPKTKMLAHIYTQEQLQSILRLTNRLRPLNSLRSCTFTTIISLLWATGMRIGEVLRLNLDDVDFKEGIIRIRQTKFLKSRIIPLSSSAIAALAQYRHKRSQYGHDENQTAPFFVNEKFKRCKCDTLDHAFLDLIRKLGIKTSQGKSPRLYDFRHTFATNWLNEFYQSGKDPTIYLPILATYLGHANITNTQVYLHPSMETLQTASKQFDVYKNNHYKK